MTAYPMTCLVANAGGCRTVITLDGPSYAADTEMGVIARLRITRDDVKTIQVTQVRLSLEALEALERRCRELRGAPEDEVSEPGTVVAKVSCPCCDARIEVQAGDDDESEHVTVSQGGSPVVDDLIESLALAEERAKDAEERAEKLAESLRTLERRALPSDCPDCAGTGSQPPHSLPPSSPWRPIEDYLSLTPGEYMVRMKRGELAEHITIARWTGAEWRVRIADVERYDYRAEHITHLHEMGPIRGPGEG